MQPIVSVCLITYKHEQYIRQAIDSVLMQKVNFPWEIIIADDCSPDATRAIILEYQQQYPELIRPLFQEKNVGGGKNFVDLINAAKGKYIAYLEGDDYWIDENKLQIQYDYMESHPGFSMCYHQSNRVYTQLTEWALKNPDKAPNYVSNEEDSAVTDIYGLLEKGWFIFSNTMFFKNFDLPPGFETLHVGDYPLHVLLAAQGEIGFIPKSMGVYRINHSGMSTTSLYTYDFQKREKNFKEEIRLHRFLDTVTNYRFKRIFKRKLFDTAYSHIHYTYHHNKKNLFSVLKYCTKEFGLPFMLIQTGSKVIRTISRKVQINHQNS